MLLRSGRTVRLSLACVAVIAPHPAAAQGAPARHVKASLLAETDAVRPGRPLQLAIRLEMDIGWHTYWRNPGDSGLPTRVTWDLPPGFSAGEIHWPHPMRFTSGPVVSYGYEHDVVLPVEVAVPPALTAHEVRLGARVSWLECKEACLPGKAELALVLPVRPSPRAGPHAGLFGEARRRLPIRDPDWRVSASGSEGAVSLGVRPPRGTMVRDAYFYPLTPRLVDYSRPQPLRRAGASVRLELARDPNGVPAERIAGVLVAETASGREALEIDVRVASSPARTSMKEESKP